MSVLLFLKPRSEIKFKDLKKCLNMIAENNIALIPCQRSLRYINCNPCRVARSLAPQKECLASDGEVPILESFSCKFQIRSELILYPEKQTLCVSITNSPALRKHFNDRSASLKAIYKRKILARWRYHYHLPKFTCITQIQIVFKIILAWVGWDE